MWRVVPESRDPSTPPLDWAGLVTATVAISALVYTIIEAPERGWASAPTLAGFAVALGVGITLRALIERRRQHPMLDVTLFRDARPSVPPAASVTVAFFALFGFIFLITQYFQFVRGYGTLSTGARILPGGAERSRVASVIGASLRHADRARAGSSPSGWSCSGGRSCGSPHRRQATPVPA